MRPSPPQPPSPEASGEGGEERGKYKAAVVGGEFGAHLPVATAVARQRARKLRREETPAEKLLWSRLRGRQLGGIKFRRQHPIGRFIADFFCDDSRLIVELDGEVHDTKEQTERDAIREEILQNSELHILRFSNQAIIADIETVTREIARFVQTHSQERNQTPPSPEASGEGGWGGEG